MNVSIVLNYISDFTGRERTILVWGLTVTMAYLITHFYPDYTGEAWMTVIALNLVNYLYTSGLSLKADLNLFWIVTALTAVMISTSMPDAIILPLLGTLGFYYTSLKTEGSSHRIYKTAAMLNLATLLIYFFGSGQIEIYLLLSFVQGAPMLIDFFAE